MARIHGAAKKPGIQWRKGPGGKTKWPMLPGLKVSRLCHLVNPVTNLSASGKVNNQQYLQTYSKPTQHNSTTLEHSSGFDTTRLAHLVQLVEPCQSSPLWRQQRASVDKCLRLENTPTNPFNALQAKVEESYYYHLLWQGLPRIRCTANNKLCRWRTTW